MLWIIALIFITVWVLELVISYSIGRIRSYPPRGHRHLCPRLDLTGASRTLGTDVLAVCPGIGLTTKHEPTL